METPGTSISPPNITLRTEVCTEVHIKALKPSNTILPVPELLLRNVKHRRTVCRGLSDGETPSFCSINILISGTSGILLHHFFFPPSSSAASSIKHAESHILYAALYIYIYIYI